MIYDIYSNTYMYIYIYRSHLPLLHELDALHFEACQEVSKELKQKIAVLEARLLSFTQVGLFCRSLV